MSSKHRTADELIEAYRCALVILGEDLDSDCRHQDHQHSEIADEHALAASRYAAAKLALKRGYAAACGRQRTKLEEELGKKPTVAQVELAGHTDAEYVAECDRLSELKRLELRWEALREASRGRGFSLRLVVDREIAGLVSYDGAAPTKRTQKSLEGRSESAYDKPAESGSGRARL